MRTSLQLGMRAAGAGRPWRAPGTLELAITVSAGWRDYLLSQTSSMW